MLPGLSVGRGAVGALIVGVAAIGIASHGVMSEQAEVRHAALAPFVAVEHRRATLLCDDFTIAAARHLARSYSNSASCPVRVRAVFALASSEPRSHTSVGAAAETVGDIAVDGRRATATMRFRAAPAVARHIALEDVGGRWRVSTFPVVVVVEVCRGHGVRECRKVIALAVASVTARLGH